MKKIVLTISRGSLARNLLQNDFYKILCEKYAIVILTSAAEDVRFREEFAHPNVSFVLMTEVDHSRLDRFFFFFHKNLIYNATVNQKNHWGSIGNPKSMNPTYFSYILKKIIFSPLSKLKFLRDIARFLDGMFTQKEEKQRFEKILQTEKPDLVMVTNMAGDTEAALLKVSKKLGIKTLAMPKSWDNLTKHSFRAKADRVVAWSEFVKHQAVKFQNYKEDQISIIGIPQFDYYTDPSRLWSREEFCRKYGFDENKRIIFFGSEGKLFPVDAENAHIIYDLIQNDELVDKSQLLIRPHYGYKNDEQKFKELFGKKDVVVDLFHKASQDFRDEWDYSREFMDGFLNSLYHSDIIVNTCSTLTLDAMSFEKPVIGIKFDGYQTKPYSDSIARWYETYYYNAVVSTGAVTVAHSKEELKQALNLYLKNPQEKSTERKFLKENFCYKIDGKSGARLAEVVAQMVGE